MQIDLSAFFEVPLLNPTYLGRLQDLLGTLAPSWSNSARICDPKEGTPQIRVKSANSLYESVWHDITTQGPHYKRLVRQFGPPKYERPCGTVELGSDDRSMAVVLLLDDLSFRRSGDIWIWGNHVTFQLRGKAVEGTSVDKFAMRLFEELCRRMEPSYAHAGAADEFFAKNILSDRNGTRAAGVDISKSLPGLFWLNYFGPTCVDGIGRSRFTECPALESKPIGGGVLLALGRKPRDWRTGEYRLGESAAMESLGQEFFFLRSESQRITRSPFATHVRAAEERERALSGGV
jgi:hypothetical protein